MTAWAGIVAGENTADVTQLLRRTLRIESFESADELVFISERDTGITLRIIRLDQHGSTNRAEFKTLARPQQ